MSDEYCETLFEGMETQGTEDDQSGHEVMAGVADQQIQDEQNLKAGDTLFELPAKMYGPTTMPFDPKVADRLELRSRRVGFLLMVAVTLGMLVVLGRVVQLQVWPSVEIAERLGGQTTTVKLHGRPGNLLDRHGRLLASSRTATVLFADPKLIEDTGAFAAKVEEVLHYDGEALEKRLREATGRFVPIDYRLSDQQITSAGELKLPGLAMQSRIVRDYPHNTTAGQLLGAVGFENKGLEGLELKLNSKVSATEGKLAYLRDVQGRPLWVQAGGYRAPADGKAVRLSIDLLIQAAAEEELAAACQQFDAKSGEAVVMNPRTGEILAMACWPSFNPNHLGTSKADVRRNRCVTDVYEPGSTFKPFVWAAATEMGFARLDEMIDTTTTGIYVSPKGRRLHDSHPNGRITWAEVLEQSSNIGMAIVGQRLGEKRLYGVVKSFGFGSMTGSGLPGEVVGIVNPLKQWNHYSVTSVPMGQEVAVTPLQLVRAFSAIANDGVLPTPTIYAMDGDGMQVEDWQIQQRVLSPATAWQTRKVLRKVVTEGYGRDKIDSKQFPIFGKTGTAQVADRVNGGFLEGKYVSSFVGGTPVDKPCLVVAVIVHEPDKSKGYYGRTVAAPAVKKIIERAMPQIVGVGFEAMAVEDEEPDVGGMEVAER